MELPIKYPRMIPVGDAALAVEFGNHINPDLNHKVYTLETALKKSALPGIIEMVPSYRSLLIHFDTHGNTYEEVRAKIQAMLPDLPPHQAEEHRRVTIPTFYGGEFGPDLADVARHNHLSIEEVIQIHSSREYPVYMMGFTPGFPYLGGMDERIATPRLAVPRTEIPAGSVGIADNQTGIYSLTSPGGWRIIGRTRHMLFDPQAERPFLLSPGDRVQFLPIQTEDEQ